MSSGSRPSAPPEDRVPLEDRLGELEASGLVDVPTFNQILEMDEDDDDIFSKQIVLDFFEQAEQTFQKMDEELEKKNLHELSELGHFLKGSSATLGLIFVRDSCEKIQHFGSKKDESGTIDEPDDEVCLQRIDATVKQAKKEFSEVEVVLREFFKETQEA